MQNKNKNNWLSWFGFAFDKCDLNELDLLNSFGQNFVW